MSKSFIEKIGNEAKKLYINGGNLLPSVTIAQAILESGWGKSTLAVKGNNLFGIKGAYNGNYVIMQTSEYINGKWIKVNAKFRKYPSIYDSLKDHDNLMNNSRYKKVRDNKDYVSQSKNLQLCGYATDPNYSNLLIQLIKENNLTKYDNIELKINKENKRFKVVTDVLNVRNYPCTNKGKIVAQYFKNETFNSLGNVSINGYVWRYYISYSGEKRYIATRTIDNKEIYCKEVK